jgi:hypothetical protein
MFRLCIGDGGAGRVAAAGRVTLAGRVTPAGLLVLSSLPRN